MIKYNEIVNKYEFKQEDLDNILKISKEITSSEYNCTKENIDLYINLINNFIKNIEIKKENVVLERHETEEEARQYFGDDFISKYDKLLEDLVNQETMIAIHGTDINKCPLICENGLESKENQISTTTVIQSIKRDEKSIHCNDYESLLNWNHGGKKGLVILAIPNECLVKEGLWNKLDLGEANGPYRQYKIDPDFIVGYVDVIKKQLILNPKYNRNHNYDGYEKDVNLSKISNSSEIEYGEIENINNEEYQNDIDEQVDISTVSSSVDRLYLHFCSLDSFNIISEERYKELLEDISSNLHIISKAVPLLKTKEEIINEYGENAFIIDKNINEFTDDDTNVNWAVDAEDFWR